MRFEDIGDFFKLRSLTTNPWEISRFRKGQQAGATLVVRFRSMPPLYLRGGTSDYHMFHRIFLRDEYRLAGVPPHSWDCVVDLGANVGVFSSRVSELARRVFSYEPYPGNEKQLQQNLGTRENVEVVLNAVAGKQGKIRLFMPKSEGCTGAYSSFPDLKIDVESYRDVPAVKLDDVFESHRVDRCDLLKIDIEGQEYEVLHAAGDEFFARTMRIHGEYHNVEPDNAITRIGNFTSFLNAKGFEVEVIPHRRKDNHGMFFARKK